MPRRTIEREAVLNGIGLHTGTATTATLRPAASGRGVVFHRADLPGAPEIAARLSQVEATERRTAIGQGEATIHTVEHLLAAVTAYSIDDLEIVLDGPEPPVLDGSFQPWFDAIQGAGIRQQEGEPAVFRVGAPFQVTEGDSTYVLSPAKGLRITTIIEFDHPLIGRQTGTFDVTPEGFGRELAGARTFGFVEEVEALKAKGLARGASTANAVALTKDGVVGYHAPLGRRIRPPQGRRHRRRPRPHRRPGAGPHHGHPPQPQGQRRAGAGPGADRAADGRRGHGHRPDPRHHPAPLPLPAGRPDHRGRRQRTDRRHQERDDQRAVLPGPFPRPSRSCPAC